MIQWKSALARFLNPVQKVMCTTSHRTHPGKPHARSRPRWPIA
jgi:hypothetical protein